VLYVLQKLKSWVRGRDHFVEHAFFVIHTAYSTIGKPRTHVELTEYFVLRSVMFRRLWLPRLGWFVDHFILSISIPMGVRVSAFHLLQKLNAKHPNTKVENMIRHLKTVKKIEIEDYDVTMARKQKERISQYRRIGRKVGKMSGRIESVFKTMQECFDIVVPKLCVDCDSPAPPAPPPSPSLSIIKEREGTRLMMEGSEEGGKETGLLELDDDMYEDANGKREEEEEEEKRMDGKEGEEGRMQQFDDIFQEIGDGDGQQLRTDDGMWMDTQTQRLLWAVGEDMEISIGNPLLGENVSRSYSMCSSGKGSGEGDSRAHEVEVIVRKNLVNEFRKMHRLKQRLQFFWNELRILLQEGVSDAENLVGRIDSLMKETDEFNSKCEHFGVDVFDLEDGEDGDAAFDAEGESGMMWEETHLAGEGVELKFVTNGEVKCRFVPKERLLRMFPQHKHAQSIARNKAAVERNRKLKEEKEKEKALQEELNRNDGSEEESYISVANITGMEVSHRFLGSGKDLDEKEICAPKHQPFVMNEHTMPVQEKKIFLCRYPIMKDVLCTLSSRGRCILHGKIVPRDLHGDIQPGELQYEQSK
jgi:hypothetical protein